MNQKVEEEIRVLMEHLEAQNQALARIHQVVLGLAGPAGREGEPSTSA